MLPDSSKKNLQALYLVASEEPLLLRDWLDGARKILQAQGFEEITSHQVESGFDWEGLLEDGQSLSLFSLRKCMIIRFNSPKPGQVGAKFIQQLASQASQDVMYIFVMPKLDSAARKSAWMKAVRQAGELIELKPVYPNQRAQWISERAAAKGLMLDQQAAALLADLTEGNLLATDQELEKLALTLPAGSLVSFDAVTQSIEQSARYTQYVLVDACLEGKIKRAMRIVRGLRQEGFVAGQFVYPFKQALETLLQLKLAQRSHSLDANVWKSMNIWQSKQVLYKQTLSRVDQPTIERLLARCAKLDRLNKGQQRDAYDGDEWQALHALIAELCGFSPLAQL